MQKSRKKPVENAVGRITLFHIAEMTPAARRQIAEWLHRAAVDVEFEGPNFSARHVRRFFWS